MKIKHCLHILLATSLIITLSACSSAHKRGAGANLADNEVSTTGIGENENFGGAGGSGANQKRYSSNQRTYYFDYDRSDVHEADKPAIYYHGEQLASNPHKKITIEGHTDPRGSREYNVALGERRANAVVDMLKSKGAAPHQIKVVSYGAERLAAQGRNEQDYQLDRRAVLD